MTAEQERTIRGALRLAGMAILARLLSFSCSARNFISAAITAGSLFDTTGDEASTPVRSCEDLVGLGATIGAASDLMFYRLSAKVQNEGR